MFLFSWRSIIKVFIDLSASTGLFPVRADWNMTYSSLVYFHNCATLSSPTDHGYINKHVNKSGGKRKGKCKHFHVELHCLWSNPFPHNAAPALTFFQVLSAELYLLCCAGDNTVLKKIESGFIYPRIRIGMNKNNK